MRKRGIEDLNQLYSDSDSQLHELFSEQRSNLQLVAGNHYTKKTHRFWESLRSQNKITKEQRLRLTKNHIQKITKTYINNIVSFAPSVGISPKNQNELHDQKVAELHQSVWLDLKERHKLKGLFHRLAKDFIEIGEAWIKISFDPDKGDFLGFQPELDESGNLIMNDDGEASAVSAFAGGMNYERILGFNVMTDPDARSHEETRHIIIRKMIPTKDLRAKFKDDDTKLGYINDASNGTWTIFDGLNGHFRPGKGLTMVREYYFRPCSDYPKGYYYIATETGVLFEGELPLGIFPVLFVGFDDESTSARSRSIIKQLRPYQAEVNRAASKMAEHQITLGDDKLILQGGGSISPGGTAHGVKAVKVNGGSIDILPGRNGEQFLGYLAQEIEQMYFIANVNEDSLEKPNGNLDPYTLLFSSMRNKKKFVIYTDKFEEFLKEICMTSLRNAKAFYNEEMFVAAAGKSERVNIAEFKSAADIGFDIKAEPRGEDIETMMGKQLTLNHVMQFVGSQLDPSDLGMLIRQMPFVNDEQIWSDLTINWDNVQNDMLALDRGEYPEPDTNDDHAYVIKKLRWRMKKADFKFLSQEIQANYQQKAMEHEQIMAEQALAAQAAAAGFIPSGGFLVGIDLRVPDPNEPGKSRRAKLPVESVNWLMQKLEEQGQTQALLQSMDLESQADIGRQMQQLSPAQPQTGMSLAG